MESKTKTNTKFHSLCNVHDDHRTLGLGLDEALADEVESGLEVAAWSELDVRDGLCELASRACISRVARGLAEQRRRVAMKRDCVEGRLGRQFVEQGREHVQGAGSELG